MVWYSILYCLEYDTKTASSTKHITSIQADGTTAPTTGFRGSTDCYLDFITIPRLVTTATVIVIKLVKFYKKLLSSGSLDGSQPAFDRFCGAKLGWTPAAATNQPIICEFFLFYSKLTRHQMISHTRLEWILILFIKSPFLSLS